MELEASIVERLAELRRWQAEQQERLLQHQQEQRETLSREQVRMYEALGLSVQSNGREDAKKSESIFQDSLENNEKIVQTTARDYENLRKMNIEDLGAPKHMSPQKRHQLLHDSSPSSKRNEKQAEDVTWNDSYNAGTDLDRSNVVFNDTETSGGNDSNLESNEVRGISDELFVGKERLIKKSLIIDDIPVPSPKKDFHTLLEEKLRASHYAGGDDKSGNDNEKRAKRPFLKKGQGLARFRLGNAAENSHGQIRPRSMSLPSTVRMENGKNAKTLGDKSSDSSKTVQKRANKMEKGQKKLSVVPSRAQSRLSLKNVKPPVRVRSKSMSNARELEKRQERFNTSDIESKTKREMEEVRIFELLEEKAENSSFCSTSSTVVALLQQSVQSTPLKGKNVKKNMASTVAQNWRNENDDTNEDLLLAEIVYTTQSNSVVRNSSTTYKKQYENDPANLQCDKDQQLNIGVPNKFELHKIYDGNSIDDICELPYGTDIDPNYGTDFPINDEANYANDKDIDRRLNYEKNTSLHVRFSEYNEYKTIGLTDTSTISNESEAQRHYSDQKAWSDCSATTDSSDLEDFNSVVDRDKIMSIGDEGCSKKKTTAIDPKDIDGRIDTNRYRDDEFLGTEDKEKSCNYQRAAADDEVSDSALEQDDKRENSEANNEASALADSTLIEEEIKLIKTQEDNKGLVFKSELLKTRLLELEREIEIFRKENIAVTTLKEKLQEERRSSERSLKEKESRFEERRQKLENALQEDRKRLIREKAALENRLKDAHVKAQQSKQERQEVQSLRDQLEELKEEMNQKESRWNAAQARHRSQVRILQSENSKLKQDIEKLQIARKSNAKSRLHAKHLATSNTKAIHQINKQLESQKQLAYKPESSSDEEEFLTQPMMEAMHSNEDREDFDRINTDGSRMIVYDRNQTGWQTSRNGTARKRDLYENLLKDATMGLKEGEEATKKAIQSIKSKKNSSSEVKDAQNDPTNGNDDSEETSFDPRNNLLSYKGESIAEATNVSPKNSKNAFENCKEKETSLETTNVCGMKNSSESKASIKVDKQGIREVKHTDGRVEFWYPNGNVKKISTDGTITKLIYYNGDVCVSREDGSIKYFYATTRTWHTTMSDGLEILEFPDGQVERRSKDGTVEVSFPDGTVRILQSNGTEKWALPDGTLAETSADGEKILILPNGQREVHTKDHKRREYPDGTVKLVYPDGSQETRYAGGRVRLKDKDGNLLMDSHRR